MPPRRRSIMVMPTNRKKTDTPAVPRATIRRGHSAQPSRPLIRQTSPKRAQRAISTETVAMTKRKPGRPKKVTNTSTSLAPERGRNPMPRSSASIIQSVTPTGKSSKEMSHVRRRLSASFSPVRKIAAPPKKTATKERSPRRNNSPKKASRKRKSSEESESRESPIKKTQKSAKKSRYNSSSPADGMTASVFLRRYRPSPSSPQRSASPPRPKSKQTKGPSASTAKRATPVSQNQSAIPFSPIASTSAQNSSRLLPTPQTAKKSSRKSQNPQKAKASATVTKRFNKYSKAQKEIQYYQRTHDTLIAKLPFQRIVREVTSQLTNCDSICYKSSALDALQQSAEAYIVGFFEDAYLLTMHAKRVTLMPKDLVLAYRLRGDAEKF